MKDQITVVKDSVSQLSDVMVDEFEQLKTQLNQDLGKIRDDHHNDHVDIVA